MLINICTACNCESRQNITSEQEQIMFYNEVEVPPVAGISQHYIPSQQLLPHAARGVCVYIYTRLYCFLLL